jgi:excisionase family DNA binding protein
MAKGALREARGEVGFSSDSREVMNVTQAARYLGVSADTLYKYLSEKRIPAFKLGNRWRLKKTTLDRWMERQSQVTERKGSRKPAATQRH